MKHTFLSFLLLACASVSAQAVRMPAQTRAAMQVIRDDTDQGRKALSTATLDLLPVYPDRNGYRIAVLCKVTKAFDKAQAIRDGIDVGTVIGSIATLRIPLEMLQEDFSYPGIDYLEVAEKIGPTLHEAVKDVRADQVHRGAGLPQPYTGEGVIIGVVDWGFDYTHPMFYDTALTATRILAAWDQVKRIGTPPDGFAHGAVYAGADELATAQHDTISPLTDYHGTHVAGIAGGGGGGTIYRGVGFGSDLLFSQMRNDVTSAIDAFQWMYDIAQAKGKRLVINNSWGNYRLFPLDGTSLMSQAIDAFSDLGVVFVFSAGNNGDINFHLKKTFNEDSVRTRVMGFNYASDPDLWGQSVGMWGDPGQSFAAQVRILNAQNQEVVRSNLWSTTTAQAYLDTFIVAGPDTIVIRVTAEDAHPLNGRPQMNFDIRNTNTALKTILYMSAESGTVHAWNTRYTIYGIGNWGYGFTAPTAGYALGDRNYGIGHPAVTGSVITTAAHETNFALTNFSSYGPRMDDVQKPDISAPGSQIVSSFSSFSSTNFIPEASTMFNGRLYEFVRLSGTSMSAPMVTGVVALLLEADPTLTPAAVKQIVADNARLDNHTGNIPPQGHVRWGHGKLDALNILLSLGNTSVGEDIDAPFSVYPNPASAILYADKALDGGEEFTLSTIDGRIVKSGFFNGYVAVGDVPPGLYFFRLNDGTNTWTFMVVVAR
jgi:minor extracellular serine protease Vpr